MNDLVNAWIKRVNQKKQKQNNDDNNKRQVEDKVSIEDCVDSDIKGLENYCIE